MNAKQAKQIPLDEILHRLGYDPVGENKGELLYKSPFRDEKVPSFFLNTRTQVWHDFGHGSGGDGLSFIMILYDLTDVSTALKQLDELMGFFWQKIRAEKPLPASGVAPEAETNKPMSISKIQSLQNKALIQYLLQRGISKQTAFPYVKEIYYSLQKENHEKSYFALAFPNISGGYELRNPYFKGSIGKKDITLLAFRKRREGNGETKDKAVTVFEGFFDFLSALCFYQVTEALTPVIVLNSVSLTERAIEKIRANHFTKVYLYLDRDDSGHRICAHFTKQLSPDIPIIDKSDMDMGYKDFNDF
jgi:DNA primase